MTITYLTGDATTPTMLPAVIAHVVNTDGRWGAGFVVAVSRCWPEPEREYRLCHRAGALTLGEILAIEVEAGLWVANMVAQYGVRSRANPVPLRLDALRQCLERVAGAARRLGAAVVMPRIGCGLGGGTWAEVEPIVEETLTGVEVYVYDLPTKESR